jgi:hypothetical protein
MKATIPNDLTLTRPDSEILKAAFGDADAAPKCFDGHTTEKQIRPIGGRPREDMESVKRIFDLLTPQNLGQGWPWPSLDHYGPTAPPTNPSGAGVRPSSHTSRR